MNRSNFKQFVLVGVIYATTSSVAQAQQTSTEIVSKNQSSSLVCSDKAKDVARKAFGNCLADQKAQEINDLKKRYVKDLEDMRARHQKEVAELRQERMLLRKGIINTRKSEVTQAAESQTGDLPVVLPSETTVAKSQTNEAPSIVLKKIEAPKQETPKIEASKETLSDIELEVIDTKDSFE